MDAKEAVLDHWLKVLVKFGQIPCKICVDAHFGSPVVGRSPTIWIEKSWWTDRKTIKLEWQEQWIIGP